MSTWYHYGLSSASLDLPRDQVPVRAIWKGFQERSTAHGVHHTKNASGDLLSSLIKFTQIAVPVRSL